MQNPNQTPEDRSLARRMSGTMELCGQFVDVTSTDPAEYEIGMRPWELLCNPTATGFFRHRLLMLQTPLFLIYKEHYDLPVHLQGITPPNMLGLGVPRGRVSAAQYWGASHDRKSFPATVPGALEAKLPSDHIHLIMFVDIFHLRRALSPPLYEALAKCAAANKIALNKYMEMRIANWIQDVLGKLAISPGLASSPAELNFILQEIVDLFIDIALHLTPANDVSHFTARQNGLKKVLELLRDRPTANFSMSDLCRVAGVGERSIQLAFQEALNTTPKKFLSRRRLHAARRELLGSGAGEVRVSDVANKYGFFELGRFSGQYKREFDELPSQTLERKSPQLLCSSFLEAF